jgi:hypothetical protein
MNVMLMVRDGAATPWSDDLCAGIAWKKGHHGTIFYRTILPHGSGYPTSLFACFTKHVITGRRSCGGRHSKMGNKDGSNIANVHENVGEISGTMWA